MKKLFLINKNMQKQKGISTLIIILTVVGLVVVVGGGFLTYQYLLKPQPKPIGCTQEAKVCPDGSTVSRTGPNCEFAACPVSKTDETAGWKTYTSPRLGISFKYPKAWGDVVESYYDSATDKKKEIDSNGKVLQISFKSGSCSYGCLYQCSEGCSDNCSQKCSDNCISVCPRIMALSSDWAPYEWYSQEVPYRGDKSLQELYNTFNNPKSESVFFNLGNKIPSVQFIATTWDQIGSYEKSFQRAVELYAKPTVGAFAGIGISYYISQEFPNGTEQEQTKFLEDFKNRKLEKTTQDKIDDFNLFISTFQILKSLTPEELEELLRG